MVESFVEVVLQTFGIMKMPRVTPPALESTVVCDKTALDFEKCKTKYFFSSSDDHRVGQREAFLRRHFDLLNDVRIDRTVSTVKVVFRIIRKLPFWVFLIWMILALLLFLPALVIFVELISNRVALAKLVAIWIFTLCVSVVYVFVLL